MAPVFFFYINLMNQTAINAWPPFAFLIENKPKISYIFLI